MTRKTRLIAITVGVAYALILGSGLPARADQSSLLPVTSINGSVLAFDWPAIEVGVGSYEEGPTGVTIIRFPQRASLVVDPRGGAPGTVNTDVLRLGYAAPFTDAVVFAGGASYGEEAITAVETGLKDEGIRSGDWDNLGVVSGAVIYDFGVRFRRLNDIYPDKRLAQAVLHAMHLGVFPLGAQGAGRMAMQGVFFGCDAHSGQGGAFRQIGAVKVAAFVVVNALGAVTDRTGRLVSCHKAASWGSIDSIAELMNHVPVRLGADPALPGAVGPETPATRNTTISLLVTNQKLSYAALQRLAIQVHTSMARAIQPFSTSEDGDTLFAASTQEVDSQDVNPLALATIGGEVMWDAVLSSVPGQDAFILPAAPVAVSADTLASYAGNYSFAALQSDASKPAGGLGVEVSIEKGLPVVSPAVGGPAATAGVQPGDVVAAIDGASLQGLTRDEAIQRMRGPIGTRVMLTIKRNNLDQPVQVAIERGQVGPRPPQPLLKVRAQNGVLTIEAVGRERVFEFETSEPTIVVPLSDTAFYVPGRYNTRIEFIKDATGQVVGAILNPGRWEQRGVRTN